MAIGTGAAILGASAIGAAGSIASGALGSSAAGEAASTEAQALQNQINFQREVFETNRRDLAPFRKAGVAALDEISALFGLGSALPEARTGAANALTADELRRISDPFERRDAIDRQAIQLGLPTYEEWLAGKPGLHGAFTPQRDDRNTQIYIDELREQIDPVIARAKEALAQGGPPSREEAQQNALARFEASPGFQFRLEQGQQAQDRSAAARGRLLSGPQIKETERFAQGLASQEFDTFVNRMFNIAGIGTNATNTTVLSAGQSAGQIGNAIAGQGAARASGIVGGANAFSQGLAGAGNSLGFGLGAFNSFGSNPGTNFGVGTSSQLAAGSNSLALNRLFF